MKMNPVYKRETTVSSRSFRTPLIILVFNTILAAVALLNILFGSRSGAGNSGDPLCQLFAFELYTFVTTMEFAMLLFIIAALTAGSISGERERQTLNDGPRRWLVHCCWCCCCGCGGWCHTHTPGGGVVVLCHGNEW